MATIIENEASKPPRGDLETATQLVRVDESWFDVVIVDDWSYWTPNGGYLATIALRAAAEISTQSPPVKIGCQFHSAPRAGPAQVLVESLHRGRRSEGLLVRMFQEGRPLLTALVRMVAARAGLDHSAVTMPEVPSPEEGLLVTADFDQPFSRNIEVRLLTHVEDWPPTEVLEPRNLSWVRFVGPTRYEDPVIDSGRSIILADIAGWPAAQRALFGAPDTIAPTIDLTVRLVDVPQAGEWLLLDAFSEHSRNDLVEGTAQVWSETGRLVATGNATLLARRL